METNLRKIKALSEAKDDENWEFRTFLKCHSSELDPIVHKLYRQVSSQIDCKKCGNCCREILPVLDQQDINKFSQDLGISVTQFEKQYLIKAPDSEGMTFRERPCPFLKGNLCTNYSCRPEDCKSYPHLLKEGFVSRLMGVINNCSICPIVFNVYELIKETLDFEFRGKCPHSKTFHFTSFRR